MCIRDRFESVLGAYKLFAFLFHRFRVGTVDAPSSDNTVTRRNTCNKQLQYVHTALSTAVGQYIPVFKYRRDMPISPLFSPELSYIPGCSFLTRGTHCCTLDRHLGETSRKRCINFLFLFVIRHALDLALFLSLIHISEPTRPY